MHPAHQIHLYAGTVGHSAWFSEDSGAAWVHPNSLSGMYLEARVWASVEIGGMLVSRDGGETWARRDADLISADVHGLAIIARRTDGQDGKDNKAGAQDAAQIGTPLIDASQSGSGRRSSRHALENRSSSASSGTYTRTALFATTHMGLHRSDGDAANARLKASF